MKGIVVESPPFDELSAVTAELREAMDLLEYAHPLCKRRLVCDACAFLGRSLPGGWNFTDEAWNASHPEGGPRERGAA